MKRWVLRHKRNELRERESALQGREEVELMTVVEWWRQVKNVKTQTHACIVTHAHMPASMQERMQARINTYAIRT